MRFNRKSTPEYRKRWSINAHAAKARKRLEGPMPDRPPERIPQGEFLGTLTWQAASGEVKKMVVRQGDRANNIMVDGMRECHGWDYVMRKLRYRLSVRKMRFADHSSLNI
jgi:hypothetical protein